MANERLKYVKYNSKQVIKLLNSLNMIDKNQLNSDEFQCSNCKEIFKKGRPDEEAIEEMNKNFGDKDLKDCDYLCNDCYNLFIQQCSN